MTLSLLPASLLSVPEKIVSSVVGAPVKVAAQVGLDAVSGWIVAGAEAMLKEVVKVIGTVTTPSLSVSWFSASYWQMAALAMLLTLPFLFAAAVQAVIQTNIAILVRAACFDLPVAAISVTLAAPLITLLLAATDQMCSLVGGGGTGGGSFLTLTAAQLSGAGSGFMLVVIAVVILLAGMVLLVELIMRSAAIYIIVLFLPIGFAAMVWPARRVWIKRMLETLIALILSKFAMVAILSMSVAALASLTTSPSALTTALTAMALTVLAAFSPWALLRLLPFTELAAGAASTLRQDTGAATQRGLRTASDAAQLGAGLVVDPAMEAFSGLRNFVNGTSSDDASPGAGASARLAPGGGELPPGTGSSADGLAGPDAGGGGAGGGGGGAGGGGPQNILPADSGESASSTGTPGPDGAADSALEPTEGFGPPPTPSAEPAGPELEVLDRALTSGEHPRAPAPAPADRPAGPEPSGTETPRTAPPATGPGPIEDLSPVFDRENEDRFNLARIEPDWLVAPEGPTALDGPEPEASDE